MPTRDMTAISAKVRIKEKELFEELCKAKGLTPSQAIRSYIIDCNEQSTISEPKEEEVLKDEEVLNDEPEAKLTRYMASHGIRPMKQ
jgi:antitoxin component of RelBE/YafQ-DinJ toxin-antitoxin module